MLAKIPMPVFLNFVLFYFILFYFILFYSILFLLFLIVVVSNYIGEKKEMLEAIKKKSAEITDIRKDSESIFLDSERGIIRIVPISDNIVRISFSENREFSKEQGKDTDTRRESIVWRSFLMMTAQGA